ncbi:alpha/beta hydrolase fold domain-containing protein [Ornithinimicrobium faecis]|uniref:alpha/beta hydrolase fold domain-containing protein n=1 Tax=Ornithinimicrobium faecis TaxID=2934158 RepID=UPI00211757D5|nr:alpha/beta hydrolase fold domain-containing protein [Ornithinimicrobium sp. HY1745]
MTSWQARAVSLYLRATRKRRYRTVEAGERSLANGLAPAAQPDRLRDRMTEQRMPSGRLHRLAAAGGGQPGSGPLVYWHGGAFISGIAKQHWGLIDHLATATGREVLVPEYGLAPDHHVDEALALLGEVLDAVPTDLPVHVLGDSAGGNLALLQGQRHRERVVGLTLLAPWLDLSMSNPGIDAIEPHDPWLSRAGVRPAARSWAQGRDLTDPAVSPLFGDLEQLPPTLVLVGDRDVCLPDCQVLDERTGASVRLRIGQGLPHVFPLLPIPEAGPARSEIVRHIEETFVS